MLFVIEAPSVKVQSIFLIDHGWPSSNQVRPTRVGEKCFQSALIKVFIYSDDCFELREGTANNKFHKHVEKYIS